jgi:hypothetical protein
LAIGAVRVHSAPTFFVLIWRSSAFICGKLFSGVPRASAVGVLGNFEPVRVHSRANFRCVDLASISVDLRQTLLLFSVPPCLRGRFSLVPPEILGRNFLFHAKGTLS